MEWRGRGQGGGLLHSERPKLYGVLAVLSAIGLNATTRRSTQILEFGISELRICPEFRAATGKDFALY